MFFRSKNQNKDKNEKQSKASDPQPHQYSGYFVAIEGIDGSGKTTIINLVAEILEEKNESTFVTSEPTKRKIGKLCREFLSDEDSNPVIDALLFAADRVNHLDNDIIPELQQNKIVLTDRYLVSSLAYQGTQGLEEEWIKSINQYAIVPNLTVILELSKEKALARLMQNKNRNMEKFENSNFLQQIEQFYAEYNFGHILRVSADENPDKVAQTIANYILKQLK